MTPLFQSSRLEGLADCRHYYAAYQGLKVLVGKESKEEYRW